MSLPDAARVERRTREIGEELFERVKEKESGFYTSRQWTGRLLEWSMRHEEGKIPLFRFVDVLPALRSPEQVVQHLQEYFEGPNNPFAGLLKAGMGVASLGSLGTRTVAGAVRRGVEQVAHTFIAGSTPEQVLKTVGGLRKERQAFAVDVLGEATLSEREADHYYEAYQSLLERLAELTAEWSALPQLDEAPWGSVPRVNLSVKLSALYSQLDPISPDTSTERVLQKLLPLMQQAQALGAHLHVDTEDEHLKELTFHIFKRAASHESIRSYRNLGVVLQAYLKESDTDARSLIEWAESRGTPVNVRLVKGAYWDYETVHSRLEGWPVPVFERKEATDARFEELTRLFCEHPDAIDLAVGSHNIRSVAHALAVAEALELPPRTVEFQFLYGMADGLRAALAERGERVRVYTPFGELIPGMAYLVRRLLENSSNESFLRRGFAEGESAEQLLQSPAAALEEGPSRAGYGVLEGAGGADPADELPSSANEPHTDFSKSAGRERMHRAIDEVRTQLGGDYPLWIGGAPAESEGRLSSYNPARPSELIGTVGEASAADAVRAVETAKAAFEGWSSRPVAERVGLLRRAAALMRERHFELAAWMVFEGGKPWREADGDVTEAIDFLEFYAAEAERLLAPRRLTELKGEVDVLLHEARGVAAVIAPWNFPLAILTGMTAGAIATGNTAVVKPAEQTPVVAWRLIEILEAAGLPPGVVNYLPGWGEVAGSALVQHPDVHAIAFTGSRAVGTHIHTEAAVVRPGQQHLKRVVAEMGGKNAVIVDDDADLDEAVAGVVSSAFGYSGQKCSACSRAIVLGPIYDRFLERLIEAVRSLPVGHAEETESIVVPVIDADAENKISGYIEKGKEEARLAYLGEIAAPLTESGGYYVPPSVFSEVPPDATIAREEIFGPVLSVMRAGDFEEALRIALSVPYRLTGGLFSRSPAHIQRAREAFRVGNLYINRGITGSLVGRQPFGGFALSGSGFKAGHPNYLLQFVDQRVVTENTLRKGFAD